MPLDAVLLLAAFVVVTYVRDTILQALTARERVAASLERERLVRLALAEDRAERIAALLPSPRPERPAERRDDRPVKPEGV